MKRNRKPRAAGCAWPALYVLLTALAFFTLLPGITARLSQPIIFTGNQVLQRPRLSARSDLRSSAAPPAPASPAIAASAAAIASHGVSSATPAATPAERVTVTVVTVSPPGSEAASATLEAASLPSAATEDELRLTDTPTIVTVLVTVVPATAYPPPATAYSPPDVPPPSATVAPSPPAGGPASTSPTTATQPSAADASLAAELLSLVNDLRVAEGCPALTRDPLLDQAAQGHAEDMAHTRVIDHTGSDGATLRDRLDRVGYPYQLLGENIAAGYQTPQKVMEMWTTGDEYPDGPHRSNILNCRYTETGVALARAEDGYPYWVIDFANRQ